jgi:hypothetical protein
MKDIIGQSKPLFLILTILLPKKTHDKSNLPSHEKTLQKNPAQMMRAQIGLARGLSFRDSRLNRQEAM